MPLPVRIFLIPALTALVILIVPRFLCSDWWPWFQTTHLLDELEHSRQKTQKLERQNVVVAWRYKAKAEVINRLLADQLTFLQAAAWFKQLNSQPTDLPFPSVEGESGSQEEQACRQILLWLRNQFATLPNKQANERLQVELLRVLSQPGALVLPEPPDLPGLETCPETAESEDATTP
jgi:hypothetical protein